MPENKPETGRDLIDILDQFNRKERYFLIRNVLGIDNFWVSEKFSDEFFAATGIRIPDHAKVWMDFHMDWLAAAITKWRNPSNNGIYCNPGQDNKNKLVQGNQEDVDLLIAFKDDNDQYHLVLIEAKGYTGWNNKQMDSKAKRLGLIFGNGQDEKKHNNIKTYFCRISPTERNELDSKNWPKWMEKDKWVKLRVEPRRLQVQRCDSQGGISSDGTHFRITRVKKGSK